MYPLNVSLAAPDVGFAVANDKPEHARLTAAGYLPALAETTEGVDEAAEIAATRAKLDELGISYHHKAGLEKLKALLPA